MTASFTAPPNNNYVVDIVHVNSAKLRPLPGKRFSDDERVALQKWLQENGWQTYLNKNYIFAVGDDSAFSQDIPKACRETKQVLVDKQRVEERERARNIRESNIISTLANSSATEWVDNIFGNDCMNTFNKSALVKYLDGTAKKFEGLIGQKWLAGLLVLGMTEESANEKNADVILAEVKAAFKKNEKNSTEEWEAELVMLDAWQWDGRAVCDITERIDLICRHLPSKRLEWLNTVPTECRGKVTYIESRDPFNSEAETHQHMEILALDASGTALVCKNLYHTYVDVESPHFYVMPIDEAIVLREQYMQRKADDELRMQQEIDDAEAPITSLLLRM